MWEPVLEKRKGLPARVDAKLRVDRTTSALALMARGSLQQELAVRPLWVGV
jgi:hypothetical protein